MDASSPAAVAVLEIWVAAPSEASRAARSSVWMLTVLPLDCAPIAIEPLSATTWLLYAVLLTGLLVVLLELVIGSVSFGGERRKFCSRSAAPCGPLPAAV